MATKAKDLAAFYSDPSNAKGLIEAVASPQWEGYIAPFLEATIESVRTSLETCKPDELADKQAQVRMCRILLNTGRVASQRIATDKPNSATA